MNSDFSTSRSFRAKWYLQVEKYSRSVKEVCNIFGISRKTYYKWRKRDLDGNRGYSSRQSHPNLKLTYEIRRFIEEQKIATNYGPLKMKMLVKKELGVSISTTIIYRFYRKKGLIFKKQKKLPWYQPLKERIFAQKPGENIQLDVQYIWQKKRSYRFRFQDEVTRLQFFYDLGDKDSRSAITSLKKAIEYFPFKIYSIQTDNGAEFRGEFHQYLLQHQINHHFIPKRSAPWNGKVERAHGVMNQEYDHNPRRSWQSPLSYLRWYNYDRLHLGLNGLTPYEKFLEFQAKSVTP